MDSTTRPPNLYTLGTIATVFDLRQDAVQQAYAEDRLRCWGEVQFLWQSEKTPVFVDEDIHIYLNAKEVQISLEDVRQHLRSAIEGGETSLDPGQHDLEATPYYDLRWVWKRKRGA